MGYLNKSTITVDAILTNRGREILSQGTGTGNFQITKFAVADDEIDYRLYNTAHPLGSEYYGSVIENMPVLEATSDETQILRYKLVTVDGDDAKGVVVIPQITNISFTDGTKTLYYSPGTNQQKSVDISPRTTYGTVGTTQFVEDEGYTLLLADSTLATVEVVAPSRGLINPNTRGSVVASGTTFKITSENKTGTTSVTIFGNNSGAVFNFTLSTTANA